MPRPSPSRDLPLRYHTPAAWAAEVLRDPLALLSDHAYLEKRAAINALELLNRWPEPTDPHEGWLAAMTAIARDETEHLALVTRLLTRRGGHLTRRHKNPYANDLRALVRLGQGRDEVVDRLLVSALIEARSCERFELLTAADDDPDLHRLYAGLCASERGHFQIFLDLARGLALVDNVESRWSFMLDAEARIAASQAPGPRMHSGLPASPP